MMRVRKRHPALSWAVAAALIAPLSQGCGTAPCADLLTCVDPGGVDAGGQVADAGGDEDAAGDGDAGADVEACASATEDCTNGVDDNCDGLVDCADPQCQPGFVCAPALPPNWLEPVVAFDQSAGSAPAPLAPPCAVPYTKQEFDGHYSLAAPPASCSCACGSVQGVRCSTPSIQGYFDTGCTTPCLAPAASVTSACTLLCVNATISGAKLTADTVPSGGSCTPSPVQTPNWDNATGWLGTARLCSTGRTTYKQGGCATGQVCVEAPPSTFGGKVCIYQPGAQSCPATGYTIKHTYFSGATDTRGCSSTNSCACGTPTGAQCTSSVDLYSGSCTATPTQVTTTCVPLSSFGGPHATGSTIASGGSCTPSGSVPPIGTVTPTGEATVCCEE
jgi:hypothetical protein